MIKMRDNFMDKVEKEKNVYPPKKLKIIIKKISPWKIFICLFKNFFSFFYLVDEFKISFVDKLFFFLFNYNFFFVSSQNFFSSIKSYFYKLSKFVVDCNFIQIILLYNLRKDWPITQSDLALHGREATAGGASFRTVSERVVPCLALTSNISPHLAQASSTSSTTLVTL